MQDGVIQVFGETLFIFSIFSMKQELRKTT